MYLQIREPRGEYNHALTAILMYGEVPPLIKAVEDSFKNESTFTAFCDGRLLEIQRYCPHAGQDLSGVLIIDGKLTCPRHGWAYDLRNDGVCVKGGKARLCVEPHSGPQEKVV